MNRPDTETTSAAAAAPAAVKATEGSDGLIRLPAKPGDARASRAGARAFVVLVLAATLSPLALGLNVGRFAPRLPSLVWTLAIDERVRRYADGINGPKVVFVGGSNLRFGLDAHALSARLGTPVVNYGLHASLGIDVIAARAAEVVRGGDVVVFAPELSHFRKGGEDEFSDDLRIDFLAAHPSPVDPGMQSSPTREWYRARSRCTRVRGKAEQFAGRLVGRVVDRFVDAPKAPEVVDPSQNPYEPAGIGPDGQITARRLGPNPPGHWSYSDPPSRLEQMDMTGSRGVAAFALLRDVCRARGATLCVMPPMRLSVDKFEQAGILPGVLEMERVWTRYCTDRGATLLLEPGENVLEQRYGFDTDYHLNEEGVALMQPRIEQALRRVVDGHPDPARETVHIPE